MRKRLSRMFALPPRRSLFAILLFAGCGRQQADSAAAPSATTTTSGLPAEARDLSAVLEPILLKHRVPGMAAVVLHGDRIVAAGVAGVRKIGAPQRITFNDRFHLGSDTKAMTATLAAMLVEEKKLAWTSTLGDVFGAGIIGMRPAWNDVTVQQLLAHRAGMPATMSTMLRSRIALSTAPLREQRREIVSTTLLQEPETSPGTKYVYSNTGFIVVGVILEKITGFSWEELMQQRLFSPLGITTGGFGPPGATDKTAQPWGHQADGTSMNPGSRSSDNPPATGPAGTAHMTIGDWAKFIALHLRGDPLNPQSHPSLLSSEMFAHLHTAAAGENYTSGWLVGTRPWAKGTRPDDTGRTLSHGGSNTMWYCVAWLAPEIDFAVLIACNQGGDEAAKACDEAAAALVRERQSPTPAPR